MLDLRRVRAALAVLIAGTLARLIWLPLDAAERRPLVMFLFCLAGGLAAGLVAASLVSVLVALWLGGSS